MNPNANDKIEEKLLRHRIRTMDKIEEKLLTKNAIFKDPPPVQPDVSENYYFTHYTYTTKDGTKIIENCELRPKQKIWPYLVNLGDNWVFLNPKSGFWLEITVDDSGQIVVEQGKNTGDEK
jgi:hypothetical protein